ncbi:MAG: hypothetical protein LBK63_01195 [Treponema sp.]|jgi:hypothetical protein|nr:hypothetical protein [Treponema sp.]
MSKVNKVKALVAAFAVLFLMNSCADFFSTSWGDMFKRDPKKVKVTTSNVYDLLNTAKGDPELSKAILDQINADSDGALKLAAIKAANQAAGITTLALENVKALIDAADNQDADALKGLAETIQGDLQNNGIVDIAGKLTEILVNEVDFSEAPSIALKFAGYVEVFVSRATDYSDRGTIAIAVSPNGKGTATITFNGVPVYYPCTIKDDETIILTGAGQYGQDAIIKYEIDPDTNRLTLSNLDEIQNTGLGGGLAEKSDPSVAQIPTPHRPEFIEDFAAGVPESDLTLLVMTLVLAKVETLNADNIDLNAYLETWRDKNVETGKGLEDDETLIAAIVNEMLERGDDMNELTKMIKDLLGVEL